MRKATTERERHLNMVFTTAIEGGINYWAQVLTYKWSVRVDHETWSDVTEAADFYADITDEGVPRRIDADVISRGIREAYAYFTGPDSYNLDPYQWRAIYNLRWSKWDDVDYDATTADIVVQFGLFGELIYG